MRNNRNTYMHSGTQRFALWASKRKRGTSGVVGGALATLILHAMLFATVWYDGGTRQHQLPPQEGAAASANNQGDYEPLTVVFFAQSDAITDADHLDDPVVKSFRLAELSVHVSAPKVPTVNDPEERTHPPGEKTDEANGDQAGHAMMFGRYMGQIAARIDREWLRPRSAPGADSFACRVQILQDSSGNVQEITLQQCNGNLRWQASLVQAIQSASPLPAPPDSAVFSNVLSLQFEADPYVPGHSEEGFEPGTHYQAGVGPDEPHIEIRKVTERARGSSRLGDIDLKIIGSPERIAISAEMGGTP